MNSLANVATSGSVRRLVAFLIGLAVLALNKKFSLELSDLDKEMMTVLITAFIGQSAWKEAALAKSTAAGTVAAAAIVEAPPSTRLDFLKAQLAEEEARQASERKAP